MKAYMRWLIVANIVFSGSLFADESPDYYCHMPKDDQYFFAYPGDRAECEKQGGRFGEFSRKERKYFCRLSDSGFYLGKKYSRKQAEEKCNEASGQIQK